MNTEAIFTFLATEGASLALRVLGAIAVWIGGRWLIGLAVRMTSRAMQRGGKTDQTLTNYLVSIVSVLLNLVLVLAILDLFGVNTTSFAALLAGAGLAIGTAWGGLLTHFAAGVFLQVLRPYKVGDVVTAGGVTGTVKELGLFGTTFVTGDHVITIVGNNTIFSGSIQNFSALEYRRVDCVAKVANGVDVGDAIHRLKTAVAAIPHVKAHPAPEVEILQFTNEGPLLAVRPFAHADHYGQVFFDTNRAIVGAFNTAGYPVPAMPAPR
jgi:small conductance mechanosensitive channel